MKKDLKVMLQIVLEKGFQKDPSIQGVEAQIRMLGCFH
jgi:hypothetical protein